MSTSTRPLGHADILARLEASSSGRRRHHAYIFAGPDGVGKFKTAMWWAAQIKCEQAGNCSPRCPSCKRMAARSHPDLSLLTLGDEAKSIGIDEVRELIRRMALRPVQEGPRIAIVREAGSLTAPAQSAMLKLLEEPPGDALLVLVTDNPAGLLPTVRSRCQLLSFGRLSTAELTAILEAAGRERGLAHTAAELAGGSAGRAIEMDADAIADHEALIRSFEDLRRSDDPDLDAVVKDLAERRAKGRPALAEMLRWQMQKVETSIMPLPEDGRFGELLAGLSPADTAALLEEAERTRRTIAALDRSANAKLVIRDMLLPVCAR